MNKESKRIIFLILILLFFLLMCVYIYYLAVQYQEIYQENNIEIKIQSNQKTIKEIIEKYESIYEKEENQNIYVDFKKDLYEENGQSNQTYFDSMIRELTKVTELETTTFYLIDESKNITIHVKYDSKLKKHIIIYNNNENYYNETDGTIYSKIKKVDIIDKIRLLPSASELRNLTNNGMYFKAIKNILGEGIDLGNGFISYKDDSVLIKMSNYRVQTIIFNENFRSEVFAGVKVGIDFEELLNKFKGVVKQNTEDDYIMYRTEDVYAFFYKDKIVVYSYGYFYNEKFEDFLEQYIQDGDLQTFVNNVTKKWNNYTKCEYDFEKQYAHIIYPSRGVEIKIENNDSKGIILYNNYYFSELTKKLVIEEKITLNDTEDLIEKTEKERKENFER